LVGLVAALSLLLPAAEYRGGSTEGEVTLFDFSFVGYFVLLTIVLLTAIGVVQLRSGVPSRVAAVGFGLLFGLTALWILVAEGASLVIPESILPSTVRRLSVGLGARSGAWLALIAFAVAVAASLRRIGWVASRVSRQPEETPLMFGGRLGGAAGTVVGLAVFMIGRNVPMLRVAAGPERIEVRLWALPFVGPFTFLALVSFAVLVLALLVGRFTAPAALLAGGFALLSAISVAVTIGVAGLANQDWLITRAAELIGRADLNGIVATSSAAGAVIAFWGAMVVIVSAAVGLGSDRSR